MEIKKCRTRSPQDPFCLEIYRRNAGPQAPARHFARACAIETRTDISQQPFYAVFTGNMPDPYSGARILCEPAQSKRTWTFHKNNFCGNLQEKMPAPSVNTSTEHRAFYCDRKNLFSVATLCGEKYSFLHVDRRKMLP